MDHLNKEEAFEDEKKKVSSVKTKESVIKETVESLRTIRGKST